MQSLTIDGWMTQKELEWLAKQARTHKRIVELGSFKGRSTRALADNTPGTVTAIDDWYGPRSVSMSDEERKNLYAEFCRNTRDLIDAGKIIPIRVNHKKADVDFTPDMVFIDGSHEYEDVKADIVKWRKKVNGLLCGHDATKFDLPIVLEEVFGNKYSIIEDTDIWVAHDILLTIITRVYKRPRSLKRLEESLEAQTVKGFEHVQLIDNVGVGIPASNKKLWDAEAKGDYVLVLDDDDLIQDARFVEKLAELAKGKPDVVVLKWQRDAERVLPTKMPLQYHHCGTSNVVVSRDMWYKHRRSWGERWAGDWDYIQSVMSDNPKTVEMEGIPIKSQKISLGKQEDV